MRRTKGGRQEKTVALRVLSRVRVGDGCWKWTGAHSGHYGSCRINTVAVPAHRAVYSILVGPIPEGHVLDHFRMNPGLRNAPCSRLCVRPSHLEAVTEQANILRGTGASAKHSRTTHCPRGHEYSKLNTYLFSSGRRRVCRTCSIERSKANYRKRSAAEVAL